jgi:hypothetical protein
MNNSCNYGTGNFPVYRILGDGSIGLMTDEFQSVLAMALGPTRPARKGRMRIRFSLTWVEVTFSASTSALTRSTP